MERETKVGLLAGLAVIICFSVILANRGRQDIVNAATEPLFTARELVPQSLPSATGVPQSLAHARLPSTQPERPAETKNNYHEHFDPGPPASGYSVAFSEAEPNPADRSVRTDAAQLASAHVPNAVPSDPSTRPTELHPPRLVSSEGTFSLGRRGETGTEQIPTGGEVRGGKRHTVTAGETLSRIAASHYGSRSATLIKNIFENNRKVMNSADDLQVGMELLLPETAIPVASPPASTGDRLRTTGESLAVPRTPALVSPKSSPPPATRRAKSEPSRLVQKGVGGSKPPEGDRSKTPVASGKTYQVRKGDGLVSIARDQLGDASRWREIHDLNRDRFGDPARLPEGARIRLPIRDAESRGRQRS